VNATITFSVRNGALDMLTTYEGGFDEDNPAHLAAAALGLKMPELADPEGPAVHLTVEQVQEIQRQQAAALEA
jgi:hypothetical protein